MTVTTAALIATCDATIADLHAQRAAIATRVRTGTLPADDRAELHAEYQYLGRMLAHQQLQRDNLAHA